MRSALIDITELSEPEIGMIANVADKEWDR